MTKQFTIVVKLGTSSLVDEVTREPRIANMSLIVETMVDYAARATKSSLSRLGQLHVE